MADQLDNQSIACIVAFLFIFIILIFAIVWNNSQTFKCSLENFGDLIRTNNETLKHKIDGGKYYKKLNKNDSILDFFQTLQQKRQPAVIAILAPWCGHCKHLKQSKVLTEISKKIPVYELDDTHSQTPALMKELGSGGFPTLAIYSNGLKKYEGNRDAFSIMSAVSKS